MAKKKKAKKSSAKFNKVLLEWKAEEYEFYEKSNAWFMVVGGIAAILFAGAIFIREFIFAVLILAATLAVFVYAIRPPKKVKFIISGRGISIDDKLIPFEDIKSFWIFYEPPETSYISLKSKRMLMPYIYIPLGSQNPAKVHKILIKFIPEKEQNESIVDSIVKVIKF